MVTLHSSDTAMAELLTALAAEERGLVVAGELKDPRDCLAAMQIAHALGWPLVADVLSGTLL